jgi:hypothetical protein
MAALLDLYIKAETLETLLKVVKAKNEKGVALTISINDETNQYGQNVSSFVSQTKEQQEAKKERYYVGNGKVFWTKGNIETAKKKEDNAKNTSSTTMSAQQAADDLPF